MKTRIYSLIRMSVRLGLFTLALGSPGISSLSAGDHGKVIINDKMPVESAPWSLCSVFENNTLYEGDGFIKEFILHGRYHGQYVSQVEDIAGVRNNGYHNYQHRRTRLEVEVIMAHDLTFSADSNISDGTGSSTGILEDDGPFFNNFQVFNIEWAPTDDFYVIIGKQKQNLTRSDEESSKKIKTVERTPIVSEIAGARPWGAVVGFKTAGISHAIGAWNYGAHDDGPQWIDFRANKGFSYNLVVPVSDEVGIYFDYAYVDNKSGLERARGDAAANTSGSAYEHAFALGTEIRKGRFNLISDVIYGANRTAAGGIPGGNDTWGYYVLPSYQITEKIEAVLRYGYMAEGREPRNQRFGDDGDGNLNSRQAVEDYHTFYAGFQYFVCGEHLKLMGGYEHSAGQLFGTNTSIETGTWQFAVRTYF